MAVGPAVSKGIDTGAADGDVLRPGRGLLNHLDAPLVELDVRVGIGDANGGWDYPVLDGAVFVKVSD